MFVPEIYINNLDEYMKIYQKAKVKLYEKTWITGSIELCLQCFDGVCVYTHRIPHINYKDGIMTFLHGIEPRIEQLKDEGYHAHKEYYTKIIKQLIDKDILVWLAPIGAIEGNFISLVPIAQEEQ